MTRLDELVERCNDCRQWVYWDEGDMNWHHLEDPQRGCFLYPSESRHYVREGGDNQSKADPNPAPEPVGGENAHWHSAFIHSHSDKHGGPNLHTHQVRDGRTGVSYLETVSPASQGGKDTTPERDSPPREYKDTSAVVEQPTTYETTLSSTPQVVLTFADTNEFSEFLKCVRQGLI
jgi:hypothetical protein